MDLNAGILNGPIGLAWSAVACPDQQRLLVVMERHGPGLVQMLWRILSNQADVADAYQETFCRLAVLLREGKSWNRKGFIYRTAANIAVEMLRRKRRDAALAEKWPADRGHEDDPATAFDRQDEVRQLQDAIAELPEHLRNVLVLRDLGALDYQAIASALHITAATARQYRHRAVLALAQKLKASKGNTNHVRQDGT